MQRGGGVRERTGGAGRMRSDWVTMLATVHDKPRRRGDHHLQSSPAQPPWETGPGNGGQGVRRGSTAPCSVRLGLLSRFHGLRRTAQEVNSPVLLGVIRKPNPLPGVRCCL